jgi:hypothetical protein
MCTRFISHDVSADRKLTFDQMIELMTSMVRTGHISARVRNPHLPSASLFLKINHQVTSSFACLLLLQTLPVRTAWLPWPTYEVRDPPALAALVYEEAGKSSVCRWQ